MQKVKRFDPIAVASILLFVLVVFFIQTKANEIASNLFTLSFPFAVFVFLHKIHSRTIPKLFLYLVLSLVTLSCFNVLLNSANPNADGAYGFEYYQTVIMFCMTVLWIACCTFTPVSGATIWVMLALAILQNVSFFVFYRQGFEIEHGKILLTLNFANPNTAGVMMVVSLLYLLLPIFAGKDLGLRGFGRLICLAMLVPLVITIFGIFLLTGCRSAFGTLILFLVFVLIERVPKLNFKLKKWMIAGIAIFPLAFAFLYVAYINVFDIDVSFGNQDLGKHNGTRMSVWQPIVSNFLHYLPIGDYAYLHNNIMAGRAHNTHLDVFSSYGIVALLLYMLLLYKAIVHVQGNVRCRFQRLSLYAFISCFSFMTFEAGFTYGSGNLHFAVGGLLMLANYKMPQNGTVRTSIQQKITI